MSGCDSCNLRCTIKYPGKKVPYSPQNCPGFKEGKVRTKLKDKMPMLYKFNGILEGMNKKKVCWNGK
jgi:hypothetical protein